MKLIALFLAVGLVACGGTADGEATEASAGAPLSPAGAAGEEARQAPEQSAGAGGSEATPARPQPYPDPACSSAPAGALDCTDGASCTGTPAACSGDAYAVDPGAALAVLVDYGEAVSFKLPVGQCARVTVMRWSQRAVEGYAMEGDCVAISNESGAELELRTEGGTRGWVRAEVAWLAESCELACEGMIKP